MHSSCQQRKKATNAAIIPNFMLNTSISKELIALRYLPASINPKQYNIHRIKCHKFNTAYELQKAIKNMPNDQIVYISNIDTPPYDIFSRCMCEWHFSAQEQNIKAILKKFINENNIFTLHPLEIE